MKISGFEDLYVSELQEARSFESILTEGLPKMAEAASDARLRSAFDDHLRQTREHQRRVEAILKRLDVSPTEHVDQSMLTLAEQSDRMAKLVDPGPFRDAALIASAQRIEHYEIAVYGTLATYARFLGFENDHQILSGILEEERDADDLLSDIAEGVVNPSAVEKEVSR